MIARLFIALFIVVAIIGCGSARREEPLVGPVNASDPAVRAGEIVFAQNCYQCHPGGRGGVGPAINNKPLPGGLVKLQVRQGIGAMPGFDKSRISDEQLHSLAKYVAALRKNK